MVRRMVALGIALGLAWSSSSGRTFAQDPGPPAADSASVSIDSWDAKVLSQAFDTSGAPGDKTAMRSTFNDRGRLRVSMGYYSPTLRGHFQAQWMFIFVQGQRYEFWGARILHLDFDSPVRQLGVNSGDVITRLDGIPIWRGMSRVSGQPWQMPELENHFGRTEVRFIMRGTNYVRVGDIMLDGSVPDGFDNQFPVLP